LVRSNIEIGKLSVLFIILVAVFIYTFTVFGIAQQAASLSLNNSQSSPAFWVNSSQIEQQTITSQLLFSDIVRYQQNLHVLITSQDKQVRMAPLSPLLTTFISNNALIISTFVGCLILFTIGIARIINRSWQRAITSATVTAEKSALIMRPSLAETQTQNQQPIARLTHAIEQVAAATQTYQQHVDKTRSLDLLTELVNRHSFLEKLQKKLNQSESKQTKCALLFIDLDGFKQVNDSFGHSFGDEVLKQVATRLKQIVVSNKFSDYDAESGIEFNLARLGGDEFTIFVDEFVENDEVINVAHQVLSSMEQDFILGNKLVKISASIGIAVYPDSANSPDALLQMADVAMYRAKKDGRGIYRIYSPEMGSVLRRYHYLLEEMRLALLGKNFYLAFQPIIHTDGCTISYFETLVRWQHPVEGAISPTEFIPIAEDSNLIIELGDWILTEACHQMAAWYHAGMRKGKVSVNVSPIQLKNINIDQRVKEVLVEIGLPPTALMLEITESCFIDIKSEIVEQLQSLRDIGVVIAIDDFGTGFSSLSLLACLPVDVLKIDRLFIGEATKNSKYRKILHSIAELSRRLELQVVAEGIEQVDQLELLKSLGICYIQGYLISRPQSSNNVGNKVFQNESNHLAQLGTGVWNPEPSRLVSSVN